MANALPAATFSALFNDVSKDPFLVAGNYDAFLSPFHISPGNANTPPESVRQLITAAANQHLPVALLLHVDGLLKPYFLPFRRELVVGATAHPATDNKIFAYEGELVGSQGYLVELLNQWFNLTPVVTVGTVDYIKGLLAADGNARSVGPFATGDANTIDIRTRSISAIPNKYASLFLSQPDGVPPRFYFDTILPLIETDGMAQTCLPLTKFCQVAITGTANGGESIIQVPTPTPPPKHLPLLTQAQGYLVHHIPAVGLATLAPNINLQPLVNTLVAGQQQRQQEHDLARLEKLQRDNTTVESWLGAENFQRLLRYCAVATEADLPPLWHALAKAPAKDRLGIFDGKVANEFLSLGATYEQFSPTLFLLTQIISLRWAMVNADALESGSLGNAFLFTDSDVEAAQGLHRQIDFIQQGGATPSLADAQTLLKMKINLPGPEESLRCILRMVAVYRAVLPVGHPLITFLRSHFQAMKAYDPGWQNYNTHVPALRSLKGVFHLQWISLRLTKYFSQHDRNVPIIHCPDPLEIIDHIQAQTQWEPNLTETFTTRYNLRSFLNLHSVPSIFAAQPTSTSTASVASSVTLPSMAASSTSTPTPPVARSNTSGGSGTGGSGTRMDNTHFNSALFGTYKTSSIKSRTLRQKIDRGDLPALPPSKVNSSKPMCLAWHTKAQCNSNCPCIGDHIPYTTEEYSPLVTWCRDHGYRQE